MVVQIWGQTIKALKTKWYWKKDTNTEKRPSKHLASLFFVLLGRISRGKHAPNGTDLGMRFLIGIAILTSLVSCPIQTCPCTPTSDEGTKELTNKASFTKQAEYQYYLHGGGLAEAGTERGVTVQPNIRGVKVSRIFLELYTIYSWTRTPFYSGVV